MKSIDAKKLKLYIAEGEGLTVEFKAKYTPKIDETMVAFSNTRGGVIIIGVTDDGEIVGENLTNDLKAKIADLARNCQPAIEVEVKQVGEVVVAGIPEGPEKPHSCGSGYFKRLDGSNQKMTNREVGLFYSSVSKISFEDRVNKTFTVKDISEEKLRAFLDASGVMVKDVSTFDLLTSLNLTDGKYLKNAAIMAFAKDPRKFVMQCQMTLVVFKGKANVNIIDRKDVQSDLFTQLDEAMIFVNGQGRAHRQRHQAHEGSYV